MFPRLRDGLEAVVLIANSWLLFIFYRPVARLSASLGVDYSPWIATAFDRALPHDGHLLVFYVAAFYAPSVVAMAAFLRTEVEVIRRIFLVKASALLLCFALFLLIPVDAGALFQQNPVESGIEWQVLHQLALWNSFPSLHVVMGWLTYRIYARHFESLRRTAFVCFLLMVASTMLLKIHFLLDALAGWALAELLFRLVYENEALFAHRGVRTVFFHPRSLLLQLALAGLMVSAHREIGRRRRDELRRGPQSAQILTPISPEPASAATSTR